MFFNSKKNNLQINQQGFSFIEMLVAIFVFSLMAVAVAGIYSAFSQLQARAKAYQELLNDSHFVMEIMAREFRTGTIFDYTPEDSCADLLAVDNPSECIIIIREDKSLIAFAVYGPERAMYLITPACDEDYTACTWSPEEDSYTVLFSPNLNSIGIAPNGLKFKINPNTDPFADNGPNRQPVVTMYLKTDYIGNQDIKDVSQALQTSVSARIYKR